MENDYKKCIGHLRALCPQIMIDDECYRNKFKALTIMTIEAIFLILNFKITH